MGYENKADSFLRTQGGQFCSQPRAQGGIEGTEGLIQEEYPRTRGQRARNSHSLPLAAGKLLRFFEGEFACFKPFEELPYALLYPRGLPVFVYCPGGACSPEDIGEGASVFEEAVILGDEGTVAFPWLAVNLSAPFPQANCRLPFTPAGRSGDYLSFFGYQVTGEYAQETRLSRTRFAAQGEDLPGFKFAGSFQGKTSRSRNESGAYFEGQGTTVCVHGRGRSSTRVRVTSREEEARAIARMRMDRPWALA